MANEEGKLKNFLISWETLINSSSEIFIYTERRAGNNMRKVKLENIKNTNISGIYKIDFPNGKSYIGQSQNIYRRIVEHNRYAFYGHGQHPIQVCEKAINKYGQIKQITILQEDVTLQQLSEKEKYWINFYNTTNKENGYNILLGTNVSEERGVTHPNSIFSKDQINDIYDLLMNQTSVSMKDIAKKYQVNTETVRRICYGYTYKNDSLIYPLRKNNHDFNKKELLDYFQSEKPLLELKHDLLYRWDLTIEKDLIKKYKIPLQILRDINQGKKFSEYGDYKYPIRKNNVRNIYNFSQKDIINILYDLRYTKRSMTDIGKQYKNLHRDTISKINQGKTYVIENYDYPARKINH